MIHNHAHHVYKFAPVFANIIDPDFILADIIIIMDIWLCWYLAAFSIS
jgi:hypothetical protein